MAQPIPSPSQEAAILESKALAEASALSRAGVIATYQDGLDRAQEVDDFSKSLFDWYNDSVIRNYELERRYIDGLLLANPIEEQDIINFVAQTGRLMPPVNEFDPTRIAEFDGTPLATTDDEDEVFLIAEQDILTGYLISITAQETSFDVTALLTATLDANSTTLEFESDVTETIVSGDWLFVGDSTDSCIVEVVSVGGFCTGEDNPTQVDQISCELDNGDWTVALNIVMVIAPLGTIAINSSLGIKSYNGFNDTERTNKVANDTDFQPLMTSLLADILDRFNRRISVLNLEISAIQANDSGELDPNAEINTNTSLTAINTFKGITPPSTIDISDTGLTAIEAESSNRDGEITTRITTISTEITSGDFYDKRYNESVNRGKLSNGTLTQISDLTTAIGSTQEGIDFATELAARYDDMLP